MKYSDEFIAKLHDIFPNEQDIHELAGRADPKLWGVIHEKARPYFDLCSMVNKEKPVMEAVSSRSRFA